MTKTPTEVLAEFRAQRSRLLKRNPQDPTSRKEVSVLLKAMGEFRAEYPDFAGTVMDWEIELIDAFPNIESDE